MPRPPEELLKAARTEVANIKTWLDKVPRKDRDYIYRVVELLKDQLDVPLAAVSQQIVAELRPPVSLQTVRKTLSELVSNARKAEPGEANRGRARKKS